MCQDYGWWLIVGVASLFSSKYDSLWVGGPDDNDDKLVVMCVHPLLSIVLYIFWSQIFVVVLMCAFVRDDDTQYGHGYRMDDKRMRRVKAAADCIMLEKELSSFLFIFPSPTHSSLLCSPFRLSERERDIDEQ